MRNLKNIKENYYRKLDSKAKRLANRLLDDKDVTRLLLEDISELYTSSNILKNSFNKDFESSYHPPITHDLEFLIARILWHYSDIKKLGWKIYLRKTKYKVVPDIRIEKGEETICIIEVKARAGWIRSVFSQEYPDKGKKINTIKSQLDNYTKKFEVINKDVYVLLPTLALVHKKSSGRKLSDYERDFSENTGLRKDNFILLSGNLSLDLAKEKLNDLQPTRKFEKFINKIGIA